MIFEFLHNMTIAILTMLDNVQFMNISLLSLLIAFAVFRLLINFIQGLYD